MRGRILGVALAGGVWWLTGCTADDEQPEPDPQAEPTTLASYDAEGLSVVRGPFCDRVSPTGIEHALGDAPETHDAWDNGDLVRLPDGSRDRIHEHGCSWTAEDGTRARAWVFVPPVTVRQARSLVEDASGPACSTTPQTDFGRVSLATSCAEDGVTEQTYRGLFSDAWLTCSLSVPDESSDLDQRTSAWCVSVLEAARA